MIDNWDWLTIGPADLWDPKHTIYYIIDPNDETGTKWQQPHEGKFCLIFVKCEEV